LPDLICAGELPADELAVSTTLIDEAGSYPNLQAVQVEVRQMKLVTVSPIGGPGFLATVVALTAATTSLASS